jgi:hypothetical protein
MTRPNLPEWSEGDDDVVSMRGRVLDARYFKDEGYLVVKLRLRDGTTRQAALRASDFTYHGKPHSNTPAEEVSAEMEKTAVAFKRAGERGTEINVRMFRHQAELRDGG